MDYKMRLAKVLRMTNEAMSHHKTRPKTRSGAYPVAAPAAPPAPVRPPARPAPSRPTPFSPKPLPKKSPAKAKIPGGMADDINSADGAINEAFDDEVHPNTVGFWRDLPRNRGHPFSQHPVLSLYGHNLAQSAFGWTAERAMRFAVTHPREIHQAFMRIAELEAAHKRQLENLAKDIVVSLWKVPRGMLNVTLGPANLRAALEQEEEREPGYEEGTADVKREIDPNTIRDLINKRITMNALAQGAAVHGMMTVHHLVDQQLNAINPELLRLYSQFAVGSAHSYWLMDFVAMAEALPDVAVGMADVPADNSEVVAVAMNFPVLVQEVIKGVVELISRHSLSEVDGDTLSAIFKAADRYEDEPYLIQVGPEIWRRLLKTAPQGQPLADMVMALSVGDTKEVHGLLTAAAEDDMDQAKEIMAGLLESAQHGDEEAPDDFDSETDADYGDFSGEEIADAGADEWPPVLFVHPGSQAVYDAEGHQVMHLSRPRYDSVEGLIDEITEHTGRSWIYNGTDEENGVMEIAQSGEEEEYDSESFNA